MIYLLDSSYALGGDAAELSTAQQGPAAGTNNVASCCSSACCCSTGLVMLVDRDFRRAALLAESSF